MDMFEALRQQLAQPLKPLQGVRRKVKAKVDPVAGSSPPEMWPGTPR